VRLPAQGVPIERDRVLERAQDVPICLQFGEGADPVIEDIERLTGVEAVVPPRSGGVTPTCHRLRWNSGQRKSVTARPSDARLEAEGETGGLR